jgi:hypothetical protein
MERKEIHLIEQKGNVLYPNLSIRKSAGFKLTVLLCKSFPLSKKIRFLFPLGKMFLLSKGTNPQDRDFIHDPPPIWHMADKSAHFTRLLPSCLEIVGVRERIQCTLLVVREVTHCDHIIISILLPHFNPTHNLYNGWHITYTNKWPHLRHTWLFFFAFHWSWHLQTPLVYYHHSYYTSKPTHEHIWYFSALWTVHSQADKILWNNISLVSCFFWYFKQLIWIQKLIKCSKRLTSNLHIVATRWARLRGNNQVWHECGHLFVYAICQPL